MKLLCTSLLQIDVWFVALIIFDLHFFCCVVCCLLSPLDWFNFNDVPYKIKPLEKLIFRELRRKWFYSPLSEQVTLLFVGDISFSGPVKYYVEHNYHSYNDSFRDVAPFIRQADISVANLESPFVSNDVYGFQDKEKKVLLDSSPEAVSALRYSIENVLWFCMMFICRRQVVSFGSQKSFLQRSSFFHRHSRFEQIPLIYVIKLKFIYQWCLRQEAKSSLILFCFPSVHNSIRHKSVKKASIYVKKYIYSYLSAKIWG